MPHCSDIFSIQDCTFLGQTIPLTIDKDRKIGKRRISVLGCKHLSKACKPPSFQPFSNLILVMLLKYCTDVPYTKAVDAFKKSISKGTSICAM